ncbi:MAG: pilus assembly protein PilM [Candidatus Omnitrophica bacterium]|nr:pilus assembly protein PilM [Candidatus Omnitrophota bacterium]
MFKLKNRFVKEKFSVGLDIGSYALKLIKLKFLKEKTELCDFALEPAGPDLAASLQKVVQSYALTEVNLSVSGPSTAIRYVNFPRMTNEELKQALKFEVQKYIPFSVDEVNLDSFILKDNLPGNQMLVLLVAVKKDFLNERLKLIESTGLKANRVEVDSVSLVNAFNFNYSEDERLRNKTIALLNIGAAISNLNILENGTLRLSRDIPLAGGNFTQKLTEIMQIDFKSAEALKINPDKESMQNLSQALERVLSNLAHEVRTSFDYYESQSASSVVEIFLSGGGSRFLGLKDILANLLGIEVELWNPFNKIEIAKDLDVQRVQVLAGQLAVAVGLALR